jgi:hypothetical protein
VRISQLSAVACRVNWRATVMRSLCTHADLSSGTTAASTIIIARCCPSSFLPPRPSHWCTLNSSSRATTKQRLNAAHDDPTEMVAAAVSCGDAELEAESLKYPTRPASCWSCKWLELMAGLPLTLPFSEEGWREGEPLK